MQKAIVLHADILGFSKIIEKSLNETNSETLNNLKASLGQSVNALKGMKHVITSNITLNYKLFSDNLYASFGYDQDDESFSDAFEACIVFSRVYYESMLEKKLPIRGGISFGHDYSDENMIFSHALVKAYNLESEKAIYPRIVIDQELIDTVKGTYKSSNAFFKIINNSIIKDQEKIYFINPCGLTKDFMSEIDASLVEELNKEYIQKRIKFARSVIFSLDNDLDKKIIEKYKWLVEILFWIATDKIIVGGENIFELVNFE